LEHFSKGHIISGNVEDITVVGGLITVVGGIIIVVGLSSQLPVSSSRI